MKKKNLPNFSSRELGVQLNNVVIAAARQQGAVVSDARLRRLREYAKCLVEPLVSHITGGIDEDGVFPPLITPQEAVTICCCAALFLHITQSVGGDKLPQKYLSDTLFGEDTE